jgi:hypothetical protein
MSGGLTMHVLIVAALLCAETTATLAQPSPRPDIFYPGGTITTSIAGGGTPAVGDNQATAYLNNGRMSVIKQDVNTGTNSPALIVQENNHYALSPLGGNGLFNIFPQKPGFDVIALGYWNQTAGACPALWGSSTSYTSGNTVINAPNIYTAATSGTSSSTVPGGPTGSGTGITDGSLTWNYTSSASSCGQASFDAQIVSGSYYGNRPFQSQDVVLQTNATQNGHDSVWGQDIFYWDQMGEPPQSFAGTGLEIDYDANGPDAPQSQYDPLHVNRRIMFVSPSVAAWSAWSSATVYHAPGNVRVGSVIVMPNPFSVRSVYKVLSCAGNCTSGGTTPTFPSSGSVTETTANGSVTWTYEQPYKLQIGTGFWVDGTSGCNCEYGSVFASNAEVSNAFLDFSEGSLDNITNPNASAAAIRVAANMPIDLSGNGTLAGQNKHTLQYTTAFSQLAYFANGVTTLTVDDSGNLATHGTLSAAGALRINGTVSGTAVINGLPSGTPTLQVPNANGTIALVDSSGNSIVAGTLTEQGHVISTQATAPTVAQSGGTGLTTLNAQATDVKGTATEGTLATGFVVTFHTVYPTAPDCVVTSPTGTALTSYMPATSSLTVANVAATDAKFSYQCIQ